MAYLDRFYTTGTVDVINGSATVNGANTGWQTALVDGGVFYAGGGSYPILSVESETRLILAIPYSGQNAWGVNYAIDRQRASAISNIAMNDRLAQIIREISIGNIEDLNALELVANRIICTDANGGLAQSEFTLLAKSFVGKASGADMWATMGASGGGSRIRLPDGTILMRGQATLPAPGFGTITFPTAFPNALNGVLASVGEDAGGAYTYIVTARPVDRTSFYAVGHAVLNGGTLQFAAVNVQWFAWGS